MSDYVLDLQRSTAALLALISSAFRRSTSGVYVCFMRSTGRVAPGAPQYCCSAFEVFGERPVLTLRRQTRAAACVRLQNGEASSRGIHR